VLEAVDGFDETFRFSGEDADLGWRAAKAGYRSSYAQDVVVHHAVHRRGLRQHLRSFWKFRDVARLRKRHPETRRGYVWRVFWTRNHAWLLLAAAGATFGWLVTPWAFLAGVPYAGILYSFRIESTALPLRLVQAPARVVADVGEMATLLVGSVRHRTPLL
jgi:hypothetical protein